MKHKRTALSLLLIGSLYLGCGSPELYNAADPGSDDFQILSLVRCAIGDPNSFCYIGLSPITPVYPNHAGWNDYVLNDGGNDLKASGQSCTGSETTRRACIHAGIMRKVETTRSSCLTLKAADSLGALDWICRDDTGRAVFTANGFKPGRKLSDLLDPTGPAWRFMSVTVTDNISRSTTTATRPWSNPVVIDNDGIGAGQSSAGTVYLITANPAALITLDQPKVAYVIMPGVVHTGTATGGETIVTINSANFIWLEGEIDLNNADSTAYQINSNFLEGRGIRVYDGTGTAFPLIGGGNMRFSDLYITDTNNAVLLNTSNNILRNVYIHNSPTALNFASPGNLVMDAVITGSNNNPVAFNAGDNVLINVTAAGATTNVLNITGGSHSLFVNLVSMNGGTSSIVQNSVNSVGYLNLAVGHSQVNGYDLVGGANNNTFSGYFLAGNNSSSDCDITGGPANPGITSNCAPADNSDHILELGLDFSSSFVGRITSDDTVNKSDSAGSAAFASITDWTRFENDFRGWGPNGTSISDTSLRTLCTTTCNIWDWSISAGDQLIRGRLAEPQGVSTFTHTFSAGGSETFLRNAVELMEDGYGDNDGLCEAGERCLYTPNIGAYQGHGTMSAYGSITGGTIKNVLLFRYEVNGR